MAEEHLTENNISFDQPWNPISYFEEEGETGDDESQYSPNHLASLFDPIDSNVSAVNDDLERSKILHHTYEDPYYNNYMGSSDNTDVDNFTLETENGLKVLDTTIAINRKAIYNDFDRLRKWQQSIDGDDNKDELFIDKSKDVFTSVEPKASACDKHENDSDINLLLDPFASVVDDDDKYENLRSDEDGAEDRLKQLTEHMNESDYPLLGDISNLNSPVNELNSSSKDLDLLENNFDLDSSQQKTVDFIGTNTGGASNEEEDFSLLDDLLEDIPDDTNVSLVQIKTATDFPHTLFDLPLPNELSVDDPAEAMINSSDTSDVDKIVELASNIVVIPPTPESATTEDTMKIIELKTDLDIDLKEEEACYSVSTDDIKDEKDITDTENLDNGSLGDSENVALPNVIDEIDEDLSPPPAYDDSLNNESNDNTIDIDDSTPSVQSIEPVVDVDLISEKGDDVVDNSSNSKNICENKRSDASMITEVENVSKEEESEISGVTQIDNYNPADPSKEELNNPEDVTANVCSCANISSVCDGDDDSLKCLTPDGDSDDGNDGDDSDAQDVEAYMSTQDNHDDKEENSVSPLPGVNFEIEKGQGTNTNNNDIEQQDNTDILESASQETLSSDSGVEERSPQIDDNKLSLDPNQSSAAVGFSNEIQESPEELDKMLEDLESDIDITSELTKTETEVASVRGPVSSIIESTVEPLSIEENVDEVALAAASDVNNVQNTEIDQNIDHNAVQNEQVLSIETESSVESRDSVVTDPSESNDLSPSFTREGNGELRTSLRRAGSTSAGSGRRVRFSLNPQYEGENDSGDSSTSVAPSSQEETQDDGAAALGEQNAEAPSETPELLAPAIPSEIQNLGWVAPEWVPDEQASNCMKCNMKFTVVKRRHHCRACGKVLCSVCCNMKYCMPYLNYKYVRVCQSCCDIMVSQALSDSPTPAAVSSPQPPATVPTITTTEPSQSIPPLSQLPQAPPPYSETADGHTERLGSASSDVPPYSEHSPRASHYAEQPAPILPAAVQGLDILPGSGRMPTLTGAQLTEIMNFQLPAYTPTARQRQNRNRTESEMSAVIMFNSTATNLPPILRRNNEETRIVNNPDLDTLFRQIYDENEDPISFIVNKNLVVRVKVYNLDCCVERKCWCFTSDGMGASNQEEIVILIKCDSYDVDERMLTRKVLQQMNHIFEKAKHGNPVSDLEQIEFDASMCCMPKNTGMLFFKHSLQCIKKLLIPTSPYLFGMYIERSELPWAKNFPLRLMLRVGAEYKYYPCPLLNILDRPAVYDGVGRTILELLADFRNFQYTIPRVVGVTINLRGKDTILRLPQHRYDEILKAVNSCEQNVLSLAGNFSSTCDGHLVSVEKDGRYKTQTLSIVLKANRKVTCASFIVISAALKTNQEGIKAKASIVEDGVMVQVTADVMKEFKQAIKDMKEYSVTTGDPNSPDETSSKVGIEWTASDVMDRPRLLSPIDGTSFDNLTNMKIRHSYDYTSNSLTAKIHWVEVYFLPQDNDTVQRLSARELGQMTSSIAKACMSALSAHLMALLGLEMTRIGLRVNLAADFVEYKIGANLSTLPAELLPNLDDKLVPAIHAVMSSAQERVAVELIFQVVKIV